MTKKRCKVKLWIVAIITLIGLALTFASFVLPWSGSTYNGFFKAMNFGYDVSGGYLSTYKASDEMLSGDELNSKLNLTVQKINSSLGSLGLVATKQGDRIRIELSNSSYNDVASLYSNKGIDIFSLLASESGISFSSSQTDSKAEGYVDGSYISNVTTEFNNGYYGVTVNFTSEGKEKFKSLTGSVSSDEGNLYMFLNTTSSGEEISSSYWGGGSASSITLYYQDEQVAKAISYEISALAKPILLTQISSSSITSGLNSSANCFFGNEKVLLIVGLALVFVGCMTFLGVKYKMFGVLAILSTFIFLVLDTFLLQSIPLAQLDFNGILGVLASFVLLMGGFVTIFEKIKKEYAIGKKIPNSVRSGFKKNLLLTLEKYIFALLFCAVFYIVGSNGLQNFAVSLFVGLFVNYFVLFVALHGTIALFVTINPTKKSLYNLKREAIKNEI